MREFRIQLTSSQKAFRVSKARYRALVGGRGSGKSFVGALDLAARAMEPGRGGLLYGVYSPTYGMLKDATMRSLVEIGERMCIVKGVNRSDMTIRLGNDSEIICRSLDDPERARGPNLAGVWLDEASLIRRDAFDVVIASLRGGKGSPEWLSATFTPKGKAHWTYEVFGSPGPDTALFHTKTRDNPFLPPGFINSVRGQYTEHFAKQELEGEFVDPPGAVFLREWFQVVEEAPEDLQWARYWDLAASTKTTADYTASAAVGMDKTGQVYVKDVIRGRWEWPDQERILIQTMLNEPGTIQGVEKALHGIAALQTLLRRRDLARITIRGINVDKDKLTRSLPLAARAEQGKVRLVRGSWVPDFLNEIASFTGQGETHDDQVDAATGAFAMVAEKPKSRSVVSW